MEIPCKECILLARCINKSIVDLGLECSKMAEFSCNKLFNNGNVLCFYLKAINGDPVIIYAGYMKDKEEILK
jgi:hypothetical protein